MGFRLRCVNVLLFTPLKSDVMRVAFIVVICVTVMGSTWTGLIVDVGIFVEAVVIRIYLLLSYWLCVMAALLDICCGLRYVVGGCNNVGVIQKLTGAVIASMIGCVGVMDGMMNIGG